MKRELRESLLIYNVRFLNIVWKISTFAWSILQVDGIGWISILKVLVKLAIIIEPYILNTKVHVYVQ